MKKEIEELKKKNKKLENLQNIQGDLFKMLIHDLKGPVGEIMANIDLLNHEKSLSEYGQEYLETAIVGCENLLSMILNILDISKMEEGRMNLNKSSFKIEEIIEGKFQKIKALGKQNEIDFKLEVKGKLKPVYADLEIIERVLSNLLLNAIAFSYPKSEIKLTAEYAEDKDFLKVSVQDHGKGISEEDIDQIFDKFCQGTQNENVRKYSTGLGLTFCKMAVEAHHGKIRVESKEGKGSNFSFTIPVVT